MWVTQAMLTLLWNLHHHTEIWSTYIRFCFRVIASFFGFAMPQALSTEATFSLAYYKKSAKFASR